MSLGVGERLHHTEWLYIVRAGFGAIAHINVKHGDLRMYRDVSYQLSPMELWDVALEMKQELIQEQKTMDAMAAALTPPPTKRKLV